MKSNTFVFARETDFVLKKLRGFFDSKGFKEVHVQNRPSILAACEDPETLTTFKMGGIKFPQPQTGQMWLEHDLLKDPSLGGIYCITTSYRDEPNPIEGRHDIVFPMFEFEMKGGMDDMIILMKGLFQSLGYGKSEDFPTVSYDSVAEKYGVKELEHNHENMMEGDYGNVIFLRDFPDHTYPFWNMKKKNETHSLKCDVIVNGVETLGSAERSVNVEEMKENFKTLSDGKYAQKLYTEFGNERVDKELNEFFKHNFFQRCGGGLGVTRLIKSMKKMDLFQE